jgi:hypothetical protein
MWYREDSIGELLEMNKILVENLYRRSPYRKI